MSLKPFSNCVVPERTASVARAAFPKGNLCIRIFDELGTFFQDQDFADLYSQYGQPGQPPFRLALVTVLATINRRSRSSSLFCSIFWISISISVGSICGILSDSAISFAPLVFFGAGMLGRFFIIAERLCHYPLSNTFAEGVR